MREVHNSSEGRVSTSMLITRREYKELVTAKQSVMLLEIGQILELQAVNKISAQFGHSLVRKLGEFWHNFEIVLSASAWEDFYCDLFREQAKVDSTFCRERTLGNGNDLSKWPPATMQEIKYLLRSLKCNKAAGEDFMPPELFKVRIDWWAGCRLICSLTLGAFQVVGSSALLFCCFKKETERTLEILQPKSMPKMFYRNQRIEQSKIPFSQKSRQALSREDLIMDSFTWLLLLTKYTARGGQLFTAFIDLSAALESIDRNILWEKF